MAVYLVTWDLNKEKANYALAREKFLKGFVNLDVNYDSMLDSVRFVSTSWTATQLCDHLKANMDSNDRIVVTKMNRSLDDTQGAITTDLWHWMDARR